VMVRRTCLERVGPFDVGLKASEDRDMWSRIAACFAIACLPEILGRKRAVATGVSSDVEITLRSRVRLWLKALSLFPDLVQPRDVHRLLAPTYIQLGYVVLSKGNTKAARWAGLQSLKIADNLYQRCLGLGLIVFSVTGPSFANSLFRVKRRLSPREN